MTKTCSTTFYHQQKLQLFHLNMSSSGFTHFHLKPIKLDYVKNFFFPLPTLISKKKTFSHFSQLWWWRKKLFIAVSRSHHSTCSSRSHEYWLFWAHFQPENGKWSVGMAWRISNDIIKLIEWKTFFIANIIYTLKFSNLVWVEKFHLIKNEIKFDARKSSLCCIKIEEKRQNLSIYVTCLLEKRCKRRFHVVNFNYLCG